MENEEEVIVDKPIYHVEYNGDFYVEYHNLLDDPKAMHMAGFEHMNVNPKVGEDGSVDEYVLDVNRVNNDKTVVAIIMRYYEYVYIAYMKFGYLRDIMNGGLSLVDAFGVVKHHLKMKLTRDVKGIESLLDYPFTFYGKVRYK